MAPCPKYAALGFSLVVLCACSGARIYGADTGAFARPDNLTLPLGVLSIRQVGYRGIRHYPDETGAAVRKLKLIPEVRHAAVHVYEEAGLWSRILPQDANADWYLDIELTERGGTNALAVFTACILPCMTVVELEMRFELCHPNDRTYSSIASGKVDSAIGLLGFTWRPWGGFEDEDAALAEIFSRFAAQSLSDLIARVTSQAGIDYGSCIPRNSPTTGAI